MAAFVGGPRGRGSHSERRSTDTQRFSQRPNAGLTVTRDTTSGSQGRRMGSSASPGRGAPCASRHPFEIATPESAAPGVAARAASTTAAGGSACGSLGQGLGAAMRSHQHEKQHESGLDQTKRWWVYVSSAAVRHRRRRRFAPEPCAPVAGRPLPPSAEVGLRVRARGRAATPRGGPRWGPLGRRSPRTAAPSAHRRGRGGAQRRREEGGRRRRRRER